MKEKISKLDQNLFNEKMKQLENRLQDSEKKFKCLLHSIEDIVFILDAENRFVSFYAPPEKLFLKPVEFLGKRHSHVMPEELNKIFKNALINLKKGITATYDYSLEMPDGKHWYSAKLTPIHANGEYSSLVAVVRDTTKSKLIEETLKASEKNYRLLAENSVDVIWKMDHKLKFTYISPKVYEMTGYTPEEWVGTYLYQHATRKEFLKMARHALHALKNYKTFKQISFEGNMLKKNGKEIPVEIVGKVLLNDKGLSVSLQGTTRDITERKQAEEELKRYHEHLEDLVKERTKELEKKNKNLETKNMELSHYNELFVGREFRIKELRNKVKELEEKKR